jgi:hypothetical protein
MIAPDEEETTRSGTFWESLARARDAGCKLSCLKPWLARNGWSFGKHKYGLAKLL